MLVLRSDHVGHFSFGERSEALCAASVPAVSVPTVAFHAVSILPSSLCTVTLCAYSISPSLIAPFSCSLLRALHCVFLRFEFFVFLSIVLYYALSHWIFGMYVLFHFILSRFFVFCRCVNVVSPFFCSEPVDDPSFRHPFHRSFCLVWFMALVSMLCSRLTVFDIPFLSLITAFGEISAKRKVQFSTTLMFCTN